VPDVQLVADYLVEEFEAVKRAHEAISRPGAIATIEIEIPAPAAAASPKRLNRKRRIAAKRAVAANSVAVPAQPTTTARPSAAPEGPRSLIRRTQNHG